MRVSSPFFSSRILIVIGTGALLVLVVVLITGGFVIQAGPLFFSARRWTGALVVSALAWTLAAMHGRSIVVPVLSHLSSRIERHAPAAALVLAAAACGAGVGFGTYAASGSDAAGYVSQGRMLAMGALSRDEPLARQVGWPESTFVLSPLGSRPGREPGQIVATYPPGLPLVMAGAFRSIGDFGPFIVIPLLGAVAVASAYALGVRLHSRSAGVVAAALLATSPIFLFQVSQPMSDVAAAAWWTLAILLAVTPRRGTVVAAGVVAGVAFLTRPNLLPLLAVVAAALVWWRAGFAALSLAPRDPSVTWASRIRLLGAFGAGTLPSVGALAAMQWRLYGSPLASGYGSLDGFFALSNIPQNVRDYAARLVTGEWPAIAVAAVAASALVMARARMAPRRTVASPVGVAPGHAAPVAAGTALSKAVESARDAAAAQASASVGSPSVLPALTLAALMLGAVLACYLPYGVFPDWYYLRFLLPALPLLFVACAALAIEAMGLLPPPSRGLALIVAITAAGASNVVIAREHGAFQVRRSEARYQIAGRYLEAVLPVNAVILASQESASAHHYTGRPVVRWDLLPVAPDAAVAALRALGRHPVILVEDWEVRDFRLKFPASPIGALDWPARADIGDHVHVALFDPADRERGGVITDRVH